MVESEEGIGFCFYWILFFVCFDVEEVFDFEFVFVDVGIG